MSWENKAVSGRFHELFRIGDSAAVESVVAPDFAWHTPTFPELTGGDADGLKRFAALLRGGFPDLRFVVSETMAENDLVVASWRFVGTHRGRFVHAAPTGKAVMINGVNILRVRDGQVCDLWHNWGELELWQQLGLMTTML